jgi:hypothetical protein
MKQRERERERNKLSWKPREEKRRNQPCLMQENVSPPRIERGLLELPTWKFPCEGECGWGQKSDLSE